MAAPKAASDSGSRHPSDAARMKAYTSAAMPAVEASAPARSNLPGPALRLTEEPRRGQQDGRADRHVDEQHPAP